LFLLWLARYIEIAGHADAFFNVDVPIKVTKNAPKLFFLGGLLGKKG
jgi:hypothetical protein